MMGIIYRSYNIYKIINMWCGRDRTENTLDLVQIPRSKKFCKQLHTLLEHLDLHLQVCEVGKRN